MSKLCNFIDGNDRIRDENLRFVKVSGIKQNTRI